MQCLLRLWQFCRPSLFLITLTAFRSAGWIFYRMPCYWNLFEFFLMIGMGLWIIEMKITSYQEYIISTWFITVDINLGYWLRWCLSGLSTVKLFFFSPSYSVFWNEITMHSPNEKWEPMLLPWYLEFVFGILHRNIQLF